MQSLSLQKESWAEPSTSLSIRYFYLVVGFVLMVFLGLIYGWSVFVSPLEEAFSWSRAQTSTVFTVSMFSFAVGSISSGIFNRKHDGRILLSIAAGIYFVSFFVCSMLQSLWQLYVFYGLFGGMATGMAYNSIVSMVTRWFPERIGFASGVLMMGYGLGAFALGSVVTMITNTLGFRSAFRVLAFAFAGIVLCGAFILRNKKQVNGATTQDQEGTGCGANRNYTPIQMLRSGIFIRIFIWSTLICCVGMLVFSNAAPFSKAFGASETVAVLAVGVVSILNGLFRILYGILFDRFGLAKCIGVANVFAVMAMVLMLAASLTNQLGLLIGGFAFASMAYAIVAPFSTVAAKKVFGEKYYSANFSIFCTNGISSSLIGSSLMGVLLTKSESYTLCFGVMLGLALISAVLCIPVRRDLKLSTKR